MPGQPLHCRGSPRAEEVRQEGSPEILGRDPGDSGRAESTRGQRLIPKLIPPRGAVNGISVPRGSLRLSGRGSGERSEVAPGGPFGPFTPGRVWSG